ncbi:MAG TPA: protein kinase [Gemmataceae bacterium]|nr:protein kinase [Gemmataceae bacterium]
MLQRSKTCDPRRLDLFLNNRLADDQHRDLEAHLLICPDCRNKLDELAGGPGWWTEVRRYLGGDGVSEFVQPFDSAGPERIRKGELDFLEPSDNPALLGKLGPYEVHEVLGQGGMGIVLKAFDPSLHRPVAIKILAAAYAANGAARKRFAREAQAAAAIMHDHVVPVHAIDANAHPPYLVMAFIPGQSLQQRLDESGPLDVREILRIGMQTAAGLAAAHAQGIVHRDIKPANIMLENGFERVRITDFGLARAMHDGTVTQAGAVAGTPQYMAPEQAGAETVDQRADLFSLGSTLYAMCTGQAPFRGNTGLGIIRQVCDTEPISIRSINPDVPRWLEGIVRKLHAKDPARRFQSAAEVASLLEGCLAHVQKPDSCPLPRIAQELARLVREPRHPAKRRWSPAVFSLAAGVLSISALCVFVWPASKPHPADEERGDMNPGAVQDQALLAEIPPVDFQREATEVRQGLERLRQSLSSDGGNEGLGLEPALGQARLRAEILERGLTPQAPSGVDAIDAQLQSIKQRLDSMAQRERKDFN